MQRVRVNQRALIENILARYAQPMTVYRELLANADDASATEFTINFTTTTDPRHTNITNVTVTNNGAIFSAKDWERVATIAEGNSDPHKVGFFGVGFFSVFSITDSPIITSGSQVMTFRWDQKELLYELVKSPAHTTLTSISLPARASSPIRLPTADMLGCFLGRQITFTNTVLRIKVEVNSKPFVTITRTDVIVPRPLSLVVVPSPVIASPTDTLSRNQPSQPASLLWRMFGLDALMDQPAPSTPQDPPTHKPEDLFVAIPAPSTNVVTVSEIVVADSTLGVVISKSTLVRASHSFRSHIQPTHAKELERMMNKAPPVQVRVQVAVDLTLNADVRISPARSSGMVYVGFPTQDSTGCSVHVCGPFIPTMERANLDFSGGGPGLWNFELARAAGKLGRGLHKFIVASATESWAVALPNWQQLQAHHPPATTTHDNQSSSLSSWTFNSKIFASWTAPSSTTSTDVVQLDHDALWLLDFPIESRLSWLSLACWAPRGLSTALGAALWNGFLSDTEEILTLATSGDTRPIKIATNDYAEAARFIVKSAYVLPTSVSRARPAGLRTLGAETAFVLARLVDEHRATSLTLKDLANEFNTRIIDDMEEFNSLLLYLDKIHQTRGAHAAGILRCGNPSCASEIHAIPDAQGTVTCETCKRKFRVPPNIHVDPSRDMSSQVNAVVANIRLQLPKKQQQSIIAIRDWRVFLDKELMTHVNEALFEKTFKSHATLVPPRAAHPLPAFLKLKPLTLPNWLRNYFVESSTINSTTVAVVWEVLTVVAGLPRPSLLFGSSSPIYAQALDVLRSIPCVPCVQKIVQTDDNVPPTLVVPHMCFLLKDAAATAADLDEEDDIRVVRQGVPAIVERLLINDLKVKTRLGSGFLLSRVERGKVTVPWDVLLVHLSQDNDVSRDVLTRLGAIKIFPRIEPGGKESQSKFRLQHLVLPSPKNVELIEAGVALWDTLFPSDLLDKDVMQFLTDRMECAQHPTPDLMLHVASGESYSAMVRAKALSYALAVLPDVVREACETRHVIPCVDGTGTYACSKDVYYEVGPFRAMLKQCVETPDTNLLGVVRMPPMDVIIKCMRQPATSLVEARTRLQYLAGRQNELESMHLTVLRALNVIPVQTRNVCYLPGEVFFRPVTDNGDRGSETLQVIFPHVEHETETRMEALLRLLGVRDSPTVDEVGKNLASSASRYLTAVGAEQYLDLVRVLAHSQKLLSKNVITQLRQAPWVLRDDGGLDCASECIVIDDLRLGRLFTPQKVVPQEPLLEDFYVMLGSPYLSSLVQEKFKIEASLSSSPPPLVDDLMDRISTRMPLLVKNVNKTELTEFAGEDPISRVVQVPTIRATLIFSPPKQPQKTIQRDATACVVKEGAQYVMCVTRNYDCFDVALALVKLLLSAKAGQGRDKALLWSTILSSSVESLENKGFVVQPKKAKAVVTPLPSSKPLLPQSAPPLMPGPASASQVGGEKDVGGNHDVKAPPPPPSLLAKKPSLPLPSLPTGGLGMLPNLFNHRPPPSVPEPQKSRQHHQHQNTCPQCTFVNAPGMLKCEMCGFSLSGEEAGDKSLLPPRLPPPHTNTSKPSLPPSTNKGLRNPNELLDVIGGRQQTLTGGVAGSNRAVAPVPERILDSPPELPSSSPVPTSNLMDDLGQFDLIHLRPESADFGIDCYAEITQMDPTKFQNLFRTNEKMTHDFRTLLFGLSVEVFSVQIDSIRLYTHQGGPTAAFNYGGSLYFNLWVQRSVVNLPFPRQASYWFGVFAHELSHNNVSAHDALFASSLEVMLVEHLGLFQKFLQRRGFDLPE